MSALLSSFAASLQDEEDAALTTQSDLSFTPRPSLWEHVSSLLQPAERNEAKLVIGPALILDNQQLHNEVRSLLDMVTCLQTPTQLSNNSPHTNESPSTSPTGFSTPLPNGIPPLRLRGFEADRTEHLKSEIAQLIAAIRDKARRRGDSDTDRIWTPRSDREKSIMEMVEKEKESARSSRRSTNRSSRCSTTRPSTASTARSASSTISASRPASSSLSSALSSTVESLSSLSIFTLDSAVTRIQSALQSEREELMSDIDYLRSIIDDEEQQADERRREEQQKSTSAPSEMELRALNKQLRLAVAEDESAERTRRLLSGLPSKAPFRAAKASLPALDRVSTTPAAASVEKLARDGNGSVAVQSEESVQSMLSSLNDMEAAFFQQNSTQPTAVTTDTSEPSFPTSPVTPTRQQSLPPSTVPPRSASSVFVIRPSSSASHSSFSSVSVSLSPQGAHNSALSKPARSEHVGRRVLSRRLTIVDS